HIVGTQAAANVLLQGLQTTVGQLLAPAAAGVVKDVDVETVLGGVADFQPVADAALDHHRPVEGFAVEREQYLVVRDGLPKRGEDGGLFGIVAGEKQLDGRSAIDLADQAHEKESRAGEAASFEIQADGAIWKRANEGCELRFNHDRGLNRL